MTIAGRFVHGTVICSFWARTPDVVELIPDPANPLPRKEPLLSPTLLLGYRDKRLPLTFPSGQLYLPTGGGQLSLQMTLGDSLMTSKELPTRFDDLEN